MKYRYLGNSGLAVSTVCLGTMTFGQENWGCDKETSLSILNSFVDQGGNFIDTSDHYSGSVSEKIIGEWISSQKRENIVLATKCGFQTNEGINNRGLSRKHIIQACEASLKRLKTDYIDLYQVYGFDPQTPLEETISTLDLLIKQGKIRYLGLSNFPAWRLVKAACISQNKNYSPILSGQYLYNLLKRDVEIEVIPACLDNGISLICWSPLSGGMLTGKYKDSEKPIEDTRISLRPELSEKKYIDWYQKSFSIVNKLNELSLITGQSQSIISLAWLLSNNSVASVIVGARKIDQIVENCKAGEWTLPDKYKEELDQLSRIEWGYPLEWCQTNNKNWFEKIS